ncbi:MAG: phosphoribosylpyrophosphate synthetase [Vicingaceae bacterium]
MSTHQSYTTVSEAMNDLNKRGYINDIKLLVEKECLYCDNTEQSLNPNEFKIDEQYRFEGNTDPGDEMIVYGISSDKYKIKGVLVNAFGVYSNSETAKIVEKLKKT